MENAVSCRTGCEDLPTISCDDYGNWIDPIEQKNEDDFMNRLTSCKSYEEFMVNSDIVCADYNYAYFGFSCIEELQQFVKDYYASKERFLPNGIG